MTPSALKNFGEGLFPKKKGKDISMLEGKGLQKNKKNLLGGGAKCSETKTGTKHANSNWHATKPLTRLG